MLGRLYTCRPSIRQHRLPDAANGALGPGNAAVTGLLNGSWNVTVSPDPNDSGIIDWTVTVSLTEAFENDLAGSYTDNEGAATLNHDYANDVGGSYSFMFQATGTTTQTGVGSIIAGTYTLVENNPYTYRFSDTSVANALSGVPEAGASSANNETTSVSGSHNFAHIDTSGSFSSGGGLPSSGGDQDGGSGGDNVAGPTLASNFIDNEQESSSSADASSGNFKNGSPDGSDQGGSIANDSFNYTRNQFAAGNFSVGPSYEGTGNNSGLAWSDDASFKDVIHESQSSSQSESDQFGESVADGQISGGVTESITTSDSFDDTESGNWNITPNSYSLTDGTFDDHASDSESDQIAETGSESENMNGIASNDSFTFKETDNASDTSEEDGTDSDQGTNFTANGSFDDTENAGDQIDYSDSGSYSGTVQGSGQGSGTTGGSTGGSAPPTTETVSGSFSDGDHETDSANESDNGTFSDNNNQISDNGEEQDSAQTNDNYQSSGSDSESDANGSYADYYSDTGNDTGTLDNNDTFSDSPTSDTVDGTAILTINDNDNGTSGDNGTSTSPTSNITFNDSLIEDATDSAGVTDNYDDTSDPATGSFDDQNQGTAFANDGEDQTVSWGVQGTISGSNAYTFNEGGGGTGKATDNVNETFDDIGSDTAGEADTDNGTFSDGDNSKTNAFYNDQGSTTSPGMIVNYTDSDKQQETDTVDDNGTFSDGAGTHDVGDNFDDTDHIEDNQKSTADGTYNQAGVSGAFSVKATDDKTDDGTDEGNSEDDVAGGVETNSGTDNFKEDDKDHSTFNEKDSGQFTGGATGTYMDTQSTDDTTTQDDGGTTITTANAATTTGTYDDEIHDITNDTSKATETQGPITTTGSHTDFSDVDDKNDGDFTDKPAGDTVDGSFDDKETDLTTDGGSQTISVPGDTSSQNGYDATLSIDSSDGSETGAAGSPSDSGEGKDDTLEVDGGGASRQITAPNSSQSQSSSGQDVDRGHADGDFTNNGGAIVSEDLNYSDHDKSKYQSRLSRSTSGANALGGTSSWSETSTYNDKSKVDDSGERVMRDVAGSPDPVTTDDGTAKDIDHGTSSYTTQTTITSPGGSVGWTIANGDTSDDLTSDNYDVTGASRTDDESFSNEDRPTAEYHYHGNYAAPGDPGTNWSSTEDDVTKGDDTDKGTVDESNGKVTNETDNFTDVTNSTSDTNYNAASDGGANSGVGAVAVTTVPVLIMQYIGPWDAYTGPFSASWSGPGLSGDAARTFSATASSTNDDKETDRDSGTTTDVNGTINTSETFSKKNTDNYSDNTSQSGTATYGNGQQQWKSTASDKGTETDTSGGKIKAGVTTDTYNNSGEELDTADYSSSWYAGSGSNGRGGLSTDDLQATSTSSETGGYTTAAPGTVVQVTADNPDGYAITTQTITEDQVITEDRIQQMWATGGDASSSVSGAGIYKGVGKVTFDSSSTVSVNAAAGSDVQSGVFSASYLVAQGAKYGETGSFTSDYAKANWTHGYQQVQTISRGVIGEYGGGALVGSATTDAATRTTTLTVSTRTPGSNTWYTTSGTSTTGYSTKGGNSADGKAPPAPEDPSAGAAPAAHGSTIVSFTQPVEPLGGAEIDFTEGHGPVRIIGILGNGESVNDQATGVFHITKDLHDRVEKAEHQTVPKPKLYASTPGDSPTAQQIAREQMKQIRLTAKGLKGDEVLRIALIGDSYGADKAIKVAGLLQEMINKEGLRVQIHLRTMDAIDPTSALPAGVDAPRGFTGSQPTTNGPQDSAGNDIEIASWQNWFQTLSNGFYLLDKFYNIPLNGKEYADAANHNANGDLAKAGVKPDRSHLLLDETEAMAVVDSFLPAP
ncbi:MAG TPA: hypothetical protein VFI31_02710 [Pirellulales bacterium]|nr:hypothetical protein [Pirellulales bacterium]